MKIQIQAQVNNTTSTLRFNELTWKWEFPMDGLNYPITNGKITVDHPIYPNETMQEPVKILSVELTTDGLLSKYGFADGEALEPMYRNIGINPMYYRHLTTALLMAHAVPAAGITSDDVLQYVTVHNPVKVKESIAITRKPFTITREDVLDALTKSVLPRYYWEHYPGDEDINSATWEE